MKASYWSEEGVQGVLNQSEETAQRPQVPWRLRDLGLALGWVAAAAILTSIVLALIFIGPGSTTVRPPQQEPMEQELRRVFGVEPTAPLPAPPLPESETEARDWTIPAALGLTLLVEVAFLGSAVWFGARRYRRGWDVLGFRRPLRGWWTPVAVLFGAYLVLGIYVAIVELLGLADLAPQSTLPEDVFKGPFTLPLAGLLALLAAPLAEETFFRGFLFPGLRNRWGTLRAALASSFFFAVLHFNIGSIIPFTVIGMLLAWAYVVSGSLWMAIGAHFAFNAISFFITIATGGGT
jgi:membrane protease YdiL (CAAX protease family)